MFKFYLFFGILAVSVACSFFAGYQIASGKAAKNQVKVTKEAIKDSNEDKKAIIDHIKKTKSAKSGAVREIIKIQKIYVPGECPLNIVGELHNQAIAQHPTDLYIQ